MSDFAQQEKMLLEGIIRIPEDDPLLAKLKEVHADRNLAADVVNYHRGKEGWRRANA